MDIYYDIRLEPQGADLPAPSSTVILAQRLKI
jgi:hypothetical protein